MPEPVLIGCGSTRVIGALARVGLEAVAQAIKQDGRATFQGCATFSLNQRRNLSGAVVTTRCIAETPKSTPMTFHEKEEDTLIQTIPILTAEEGMRKVGGYFFDLFTERFTDASGKKD